MDKFFKLFVILLFSLVTATAHAKKFTSQYCEFVLPSGWTCALEGTEWVCQSSNKDRQREAIIIFAAKVRGQQDGLPQYQAFLKKTKTFVLPGGKTQVSEPKYTKKINVKGHPWIDSMHLASEVPGFFTRYLATVKEDLGVAVTFSVSKEHYASYQPLFDNIVRTLHVFRQKNKQIYKQLKTAKDKKSLLEGTVINPDGPKFDLGSQKKKGKAGSSDDMNLILILALLGVVGFIIFRAKKGKGKSKGKAKSGKKKKTKKKL